jgi:predicted GIY-YIG superfamily endonuclease
MKFIVIEMDYKNGKIYAIRSHQTDEIYIGSTTQSLSKRFSNHKSKYKLYLEKKRLRYKELNPKQVLPVKEFE